MKNLIYILSLIVVVNSCTKYESEILSVDLSTPAINDSENYFPHEEYYKWTYEDDDGYDVEWQYNSNSSQNDNEGFVYLGNRYRSVVLFGGSPIWESYWVKKTEEAIQIKTSEYYNYLTILELVPYPITLFTKNVALGSTWSENINIEYTQYYQVTEEYLSNQSYPTTLEYEIIGYDENVYINGTLYTGVNTYRIDYNIGIYTMYREIMLAKDVGIIRFDDQDESLSLQYFQ